MEQHHHDDVPSTAVPAQRPTAARSGARGSGRVSAIARAAGRSCSRSGCDTPAAATLVFSYNEQVARLVELLDERDPQTYDLCPIHADRTTPPRGWELADTRPPRADAPRRMDDDQTVAVLAAALRGDDVPTRVTLIEGEGTGPDAGAEAGEVVTDPTPEGDDGDTDDPLRAALEELQRVAAPDDDPLAAPSPATPLRRGSRPFDGDTARTRAAAAPPADRTAAPATAAPDEDDLTLW